MCLVKFVCFSKPVQDLEFELMNRFRFLGTRIGSMKLSSKNKDFIIKYK